MPTMGYFRAISAMIMENLSKAIVLMDKVKHSWFCPVFYVC